MTFNFANYEEHKKMNRRLFTDSGYKSFYKAMDNSQIPAYVTREKIMLSLELACTPELTEKREIPQKAWVFETPAMIVYNAGTRVKKDPVVITSVIEKSANEQNTQGLGIQQWVTRPVTEAEIGICKDQDRIETEILRLEQEKQELQKRINELKAEAAAAP